jgi:hypothetical protein
VIKYRCYFISAADRAESSILVEADSPAGAAREAMQRRAGPNFVALEVWDGPVRVLRKPLDRDEWLYGQSTGLSRA